MIVLYYIVAHSNSEPVVECSIIVVLSTFSTFSPGKTTPVGF